MGMEPPACDCPQNPRLLPEIRTLFTQWNVGRRFYGCSKFNLELEDGGTQHCGYFRWHDGPQELPEHIDALILGLKGDNRNQHRIVMRVRLENEKLRRDLGGFGEFSQMELLLRLEVGT